MFKKIFIVLIIIIIIIAAVIFMYRQSIIQYSAENIIRSNIPPYIKFDKINFDLANSRVILSNLKILNPPDFSPQGLLQIDSISCKYRIIGSWIPEGLEISEILVKKPDILVERLRDGKVNFVAMEKFVKSFPPKENQPPKAGNTSKQGASKSAENKKLSEIIKLPRSFTIKDGKIELWDYLPYDKPHVITVESVNGDVSISFDDNYSNILDLAFTLEGNLNGISEDTVRWVASLNPTASKLTMSNRFDVANLDILTFLPYYDKYSPFIFRKGRFSGSLIFDFDNGNIGSTNEVHLSNLAFAVKPGYENAQMWETNVPDLMNYFTTPSGDIVFDFKIKGDMASPQFYLGPISKRALTSMAIDKISSYAINTATKQAGGATQQINKTKDYIDLIRGFINKK